MASEYCPHCDEYATFDDSLEGHTVVCDCCGQSFAASPPLLPAIERIAATLAELVNCHGILLVRKGWRHYLKQRYDLRPKPDYAEVWRPVNHPLYRQTHQVSNWGRVKHNSRSKPLTPDFGHEYLRVLLYFDRTTADPFCVHVLVWEAFNGPLPEGMEINHKDRDKHHPAIHNLEPLTASGNKSHQHATEPCGN